jgi:hypothetical protein
MAGQVYCSKLQSNQTDLLQLAPAGKATDLDLGLDLDLGQTVRGETAWNCRMPVEWLRMAESNSKRTAVELLEQ